MRAALERELSSQVHAHVVQLVVQGGPGVCIRLAPAPIGLYPGAVPLGCVCAGTLDLVMSAAQEVTAVGRNPDCT